MIQLNYEIKCIGSNCICKNKNIKEKTFFLPIPIENNVSLLECVNSFLKPKKFTKFCQNCHKEVTLTQTCTFKKFPDILILQLQRTKPIYESNVLGFIKELELPYQDDKKAIYELYAVCNHLGSQYAGHYFTYAKQKIKNQMKV